MAWLELKMTVSSAYKLNEKLSVELGRSLINSRKRIGPKPEPCGIPIDMSNKRELLPLHTTFYCRFFRYDVNQSSVFPLMPYLFSFHSNNLWSMVSKHFCMSKKQSRMFLCWSREWIMSSMSLCNDVCVEWRLIKADWSCDISWFSSRYVISWDWIADSSILVICGTTDIGR